MIFPNLIEATVGDMEVSLSKTDKYFWQLFVDDTQWMSWGLLHNDQLRELASSVDIAYGKVIATGLGFCLRESMLLDNKNVTEIVVLERNPNIIEYHNIYNSEIMNRITVIECDANTYKGSCDTLLLDHYELYNEEMFQYFNKCLNACTSNIDHSLVWWWGLEEVILSYPEYLKKSKIFKLPDLTESEFEKLRSIYSGKY